MPIHPFDLNIRHLRALLVINDHGSISAAAQAVNLSQPALTQGLAKLEEQFGYALYERRTNGMVATSVGEVVMSRSCAALEYLAGGSRGFTRVFSRPENIVTMTQVRAFLALSEAGSFVGAAKNIGLSQATIHRGVRELEIVLGATLVERRGRGVWINAGGKRFARGARLAIAELAAALADTRVEGAGQHIVIGAMPLSRPFLVPAALARLSLEQPEARFDVHEGSWQEMITPLREGVVDIVVGTLRPFEIADLRQIPICEDRLAHL